MKRERTWMKCHYCNGNKEIRTVLGTSPELNKHEYEIIDCPNCDGNGGWWITLDMDECCG